MEVSHNTIEGRHEENLRSGIKQSWCLDVQEGVLNIIKKDLRSRGHYRPYFGVNRRVSKPHANPCTLVCEFCQRLGFRFVRIIPAAQE